MAPFGEIVPHAEVTILIGNVAAQDAFTPSPTTIAFDVARMRALYGEADDETSTDRIDRFFDHEYTHLLHEVWREVHPVDLSTPLQRALWDYLAEGIGNYRSLSARWKAPDGGPSAHAHEVLSRLQPVFTERISALATASEAEETELTKNLSMGPFQQKWGALTVALWLLAEVQTDDDALARWVSAGPDGILELARLHLPADLAERLPAVSG